MNVARRSLTKGQKAMVTVRALGHLTTREAGRIVGVSNERIGSARMVLAHAPDLVDAVISGATGLDAAVRYLRTVS